MCVDEDVVDNAVISSLFCARVLCVLLIVFRRAGLPKMLACAPHKNLTVHCMQEPYMKGVSSYESLKLLMI